MIVIVRLFLPLATVDVASSFPSVAALYTLITSPSDSPATEMVSGVLALFVTSIASVFSVSDCASAS